MLALHKNLWHKFIQGDRKSLAIIFKKFYEELFNYGLKLTGSDNITEDSLQELFFKLWKNRNHLTEVNNLKSYLFAAYRHTVYDNLRWYKNDRFSEKSVEDIFIVEFSVEDIIIKDQIDTETRNILLNALNSLSPRQKEAIYLRYFENLDFATISSIMQVNIQSVRNFIHRGILSLKELNIKKPTTV